MEVLPNAVLINCGGKIVFCNPSCVQLFGATEASQILGRNPFEFFHPDYHMLIQQRIELMLGKGDRVPGIEEKIIRLDGRQVPVHVVATPITDGDANAVLVAMSDLTERELSVTLLRSVLDSVTDAILTVDDSGIIQSANPATELIFGYQQWELTGQSLKVLMPSPYYEEHDNYIANFIRSRIAKMIGIGREVSGRRKDGSIFPAELIVAEFELAGEKRFTGVIRDITARKQLEEKFLQAQKMDAIGQLAGGVAHDFNNLLTVINGYAQLLQSKSLSEIIMTEYASYIREAGERAAGLTAQLLAFSRKTILSPKVLDVNESIEQFGKMLDRLIGEDITFSTSLKPRISFIKADPGQLEQVLMNLAVNARDAMPSGGLFTIETSEIVLSAHDPQSAEIKPGRYIEIRIADSGTGISKEVQSRMFEPFFTTKGAGKGTGLGLATVYGIVKQSDGSIKVESEPGLGTTFVILLPAVYEKQNSEPGQRLPLNPLHGSETILVVEDEPALLRLVRFVLESHGFHVITASDGQSALAAAMAHDGAIDLLLTDVVMPGMSGREIADTFRQRWPDSKILYTSGYTADTVVRYGVETAADAFIQKPYTSLALVGKVRQTLDGPSNSIQTNEISNIA
jgi:PAS domain S-box-containing protein